MRSSIRIRLLLSHLAVIVAAMGLSGFLLLSFLQRYFLESTEQSLVAQARITAQALVPGALASGPPVEQQSALNNLISQREYTNLDLRVENVQAPVAPITAGDFDLSYLAESSLQLGAQLETRIRVLDVQGVVLVDSVETAAGADLSGDALVASALQGVYATSVGDYAMAVAMPMLLDGELVGVVYLDQPLGDVAAVMGDLRKRWLFATAIALGFSGFLGLLLSGAITRPLRQLTGAAGALAGGDFSVQVPARSRDELGRLSAAFNDMTARLRAARQMQVDFVANVSHELRTPLTAIKGTVETLRDGAVDDPSVRDRFLATVESETDRLIRLVNDLLILSRADSEALNLRRERVDVAALAQTLLAQLTPQAAAREVRLQLEAELRAPAAWADRDRVAQVLLNLLDNAIKYSQPGGAATVRIASEAEGAVRVQVCDNGVGIPAEDLPRIGQRFYRADKARARGRASTGAAGGSGLGLAIAQALVQAHGGRLWVESAEGAGTTVSFTLPGET